MTSHKRSYEDSWSIRHLSGELGRREGVGVMEMCKGLRQKGHLQL